MSQCNKYGETPLDKCKPYLTEILRGEPIIYIKKRQHFLTVTASIKTREQMTII